jgi:hypothetical protein
VVVSIPSASSPSPAGRGDAASKIQSRRIRSASCGTTGR